MNRDLPFERAHRDIAQLCDQAADSHHLRRQILERLRPVLPYSYAYFSTTDPATQLGTSTVLAEPPPAWCMAMHVENEYLQDDYLKFNDLMRRRESVGILSQTAGDNLPLSPRYRDLLTPLGMADEMRAVFVTRGSCWGTLCLHLEQAHNGYTPDHAAFLAQLAPLIADGLRKTVLLSESCAADAPDAPGVLILHDDLTPIAATAAAERWLDELRAVEPDVPGALPMAVRAVVGRLQALERGTVPASPPPRARVQLHSGRWLTLYASRLTPVAQQAQISVILDVARTEEMSPLIMQAYALTKREGEISQAVVRGWSTAEIAVRLHISQNTVEAHLKAIYTKVDVSSRGELAARLFLQPHA